MLLLLPTMALLLMFIAYPFMRGILLAVTNSKVGVLGEFVGFENFARLLKRSDFPRRRLQHVPLHVCHDDLQTHPGSLARPAAQSRFQVQGLHARLHPAAVHRADRARLLRLEVDVRSDLLSVLNWMLFKLGIDHAGAGINWLGDGDLAMLSIIIVNIWRGVPFFAISLMAGLQTISPDLGEAAAIDGAKPLQRFWYITWPLLMPVTMVVVLFSVIQTFADFQIVYVMTGGGPANATHLFATYAYQLGVGTGLLSQGAAVSLAMFPLLFGIVIFQLLYIRRVETR